MEVKQHIVQESVPGKQVTLCHLIASPDSSLSDKLGLNGPGAIGIMTITPYEASIIAADRALKTAKVRLVVVDRFTGSLVFTGGISEVENALEQANTFLRDVLGFDSVAQTRS